MNTEDLYKILGIERGAKKEEIKRAYRKLARKLHPDRNKNDKKAEEQFKKVSAAYAVLGDDEKRSLYDKYGIDGLRDGFDPNMWRHYGGGGQRGFGNQNRSEERGFGGFEFGGFQGFGAMEDIFENLFGGRGRTRRNRENAWNKEKKGSNVTSTLEVELMDIIHGKELQIIVPIKEERRQLKVKIPQGIGEGKNIRLKEQGAKSESGGPAGDLILEIKMRKDRNYERRGDDLYKKEKITVGEAYSGIAKKMETPWGEIKMTIPKGTQGGSTMRIKGKGIKRGNTQGDLYIQIAITIPTNREEKTKEAIERLEECY